MWTSNQYLHFASIFPKGYISVRNQQNISHSVVLTDLLCPVILQEFGAQTTDLILGAASCSEGLFENGNTQQRKEE